MANVGIGGKGFWMWSRMWPTSLPGYAVANFAAFAF
jgi:hypothetical protein